MKLAALVPALFVLVSMCGSPVPAPPGSVSGAVYFDSNHNRVHDQCDRPLSATVSLTTADGKTFSAIPVVNGAFHIPDVPTGDALLSLTSEGDLFWPMTQRTADDRPGVAISVKSQEDTADVEIASISSMALPESSDSVVGVVFNDANGNGQVDQGECGLARAGVNREGSKAGGFVSQPGDGTFAYASVSDVGLVFPTLPEGAWKPTTVPDGVDPCNDGVPPKPLRDTRVYETVVGFKRGSADGKINGTLYDDTNGNGLRDEGEGGVRDVDVFVLPLDRNCGASTSGTVRTNQNGDFSFEGLVPGHYEPVLGATIDPFTSLISQGWSSTPNIIATPQSAVAINLPLRVQPSGYINLSLFNDVDEDGVRDPEDVAVSVMVCLYPNDNLHVNPTNGAYAGDYGATACQMSYDGSASFGPIPLGSYQAMVGEKWWPQPVIAEIELSGPQVSANVGLPPVGDVSIPIFNGDPVQMDICYADPEWVQPSFDKVYDGTEFLYSQWSVSETEAREIYGLGFYSSGVNAEVWTHLAGLPWRLSPDCPGINYTGSPPRYEKLPDATEIYELSGFEPLSAVTAGNITQVVVRSRGQGLYAIGLPQPIVYGGGGPYIIDSPAPDSTPYGQPALVFVNESYTPIARCAYGAQGCERLD